jgi:formylglycine-generating enzyme required for sulfatase activity
VENVSWEDAMAFCQKLNERLGSVGRLPPGYSFTLPTEAQWEYACRAGAGGMFAGDLNAMAWYAKNSADATVRGKLGMVHPVGQKAANAWGLHDMHGNVWEWCLDWYGAYPGGAAIDPTGPLTGPDRILRGGAWNMDAAHCRSAFRYWFSPTDRTMNGTIGFRLALVANP